MQLNPFQSLYQPTGLPQQQPVRPTVVTPPQFGMQTLSLDAGGDELSRFRSQINTKRINPNPNAPALPYTATRDFGLA